MGNLHDCAVCGRDAPFGYSARRYLSLMRWFCGGHRAEGESYLRQINDN